MGRVRKAWMVTFCGLAETYYAPNGSKAMGAAFASLSDVYCDLTFREFLKRSAVRRAEYADVVLPDRHPLAGQLSSKILHCVVHAYGGTGLKAGYRDHFYTSDRDPVMKAAYYHGLFDRYRVDKRMAGSHDMVMYELTTLGKNVAHGEAETYPRGY